MKAQRPEIRPEPGDLIKVVDDLFGGTSYGYCTWVDAWGFEMQYFEDLSQGPNPFYFDYQNHYDLEFSMISEGYKSREKDNNISDL